MKGIFGMNIEDRVVHTMERAIQDTIVPRCLFCFMDSPFVWVDSIIIGYTREKLSGKRLRWDISSSLEKNEVPVSLRNTKESWRKRLFRVFSANSYDDTIVLRIRRPSAFWNSTMGKYQKTLITSCLVKWKIVYQYPSPKWKRKEGFKSAVLSFFLIQCVDDESHPIPVGLGLRKRKIDMTKIHTVGKDNLDSTFSGSTRSLSDSAPYVNS